MGVLVEHGAQVNQAAVVTDGPVITSRGMGTAIDFGLEIVRHYLGEEAVDDVKAKIVYQSLSTHPGRRPTPTTPDRLPHQSR